MERRIVHGDMDTYYVSVERRENSALNGKPVMIGEPYNRGVVASCSYEARRYGVHAGMPSRMARTLCPEGIWVKGDYGLYERISGEITELVQEGGLPFQKDSVDEFYIDVTGMDTHFGCFKWSHELRQKIMRETGLPMSLGLGANKTVSKVATGESKPNGEKNILTGTERQFLAPLSVRKIPGVGSKYCQLLRNMGVERIVTIQELSPELMNRVLGKDGITIWKKANGIDNSPIVQFQQQKSMSKEDTFRQDTTDMELLRKTIVGMVSTLAFDLRKDGKIAKTISVKIRYSNFDTHEQQATIAYTNIESVLTKTALELFHKLYSRRMLIRLVGVTFSNLTTGTPQIDLFDTTTTQIKLNQAMDSIKKRFGAEFLKSAAIL